MASFRRTSESNDERKVRWYHKLRDKYRLVILNEDTFEEKLSFKLSRLNVFVVAGTLAIILIFLTTYLIAFTPLREYIPGYSNPTLQRDLYEFQLRADSIEEALKNRDLYITNIKSLLSGESIREPDQPVVQPDSAVRAGYSRISNLKSREDSMLRKEYEQANLYNLNLESRSSSRQNIPLSKLNFYAPVKGIVTNHFDASKQHYGIDIVTSRNEAVKAAYDGVVFFSEWTAETGNVIAIQHSGAVVTVYKHNSVLLRKQGAYVRAGESIAIIGNTGEYSTGPHLHFELWINSTPVDPEKYLTF
ncbi:MAG: M23 family metallopeptidase [Lentimicrobium sp.]|uniref:M23 family metallopeptidase n=1 Tax=Lentimicrobium sp. TaxID=2034841 RepID=UPI0025CFC950|nr:M23 family metallopeptidase [Lentimicrobium sp.]MCO5255875.1 M23 family metallopeptidase [Lentimicrobium sp.]MCO5261660.1 M23 family metallopeptidase [Lentimicrobium sp.]HPJ62112.1 M23 family metallopeptidase [Lentimicrobium sp.]